MSPEEWLRERGIEIKRGQVAPQGDIAGQFTAALPIVATDALPVDAIETQRIPATHSMPPAAFAETTEPDIATLPTGVLQGTVTPSSLPPNIRVVRVDSLEQVDDGIDLWPTVALPVVKTTAERDDITQMPTRRLTS